MSSQLIPPVSNKDHIQGNGSAPITLVEYGDYQCGYCGQAYPIIKSVQQTMGGQLRFVFRNFPLSEAHPNAFKAAVAAEAASLQNKFWEMHDALYEHQDRLDWVHLVAYAKTIGLDVTRFEKDVAGNTASDKVTADFESGIRSGVNGTPSFFINGAKYNGNWEEYALIEYLKSL